MVARDLKNLHPILPLVGSLVSNSYGKNRYSEMSLLSLKLFTTQYRDRLTSKNVDYFICNSKAIDKTNVRTLGVPEDRIKVIYRERIFSDYSYSPEEVRLCWRSEIILFFLPYYEGLRGALIEAIITKKPSIVSDIPDNQECFKENGVLCFSPGDTEALSWKIEEAMEINDWEKRLECSFNYALKNFKVENISKQYENFYRDILDEERLTAYS